MNYYSRNSPVRRRRDRPPGFLLTQQPAPSMIHSSRRSLTSRFSLSQHQGVAEEPQHPPQEILILDDEDVYVYGVEEILVQDDSVEDQLPVVQMLQNPIQQQQQAQQQSSNLAQQPKLAAKYQQQSAAELSEDENIVIVEGGEAQKIINRNFSFGGQQFQASNVQDSLSSLKPLIHSIVNVEPQVNRKYSTKVTKSKKNSNPRYHMTQKFRPPDESWNKLVGNFIRKRQKVEQDPVPGQKLNPFLDESQWIQPSNLGPSDHEDVESHDTGYFRASSEQSLAALPLEQPPAPRRGSIKIEEEQEPGSSSQDSTNIRAQSECISPDEAEPPQPQPLLRTSTGLLREALAELPAALLPVYQKIYQELQRQQQEGELTLRHMREAQKMVRLLLEAQQKRLHVDEYLLGDHDEGQERVVANREIIMAMVRELGAFF